MLIFKFILSLHVALYRLTGGRLGGKNIILLTTIGKKSGQPRTRPVFHLKEGTSYLVFASAGGNPKNPAWYVNLAANPKVTVEDHGRSFAGVASTVEGTERTRIWNILLTKAPNFGAYEKKTTRVIPVVRIEPA